MGIFRKNGRPLSLKESLPVQERVKQRACEQFKEAYTKDQSSSSAVPVASSSAASTAVAPTADVSTSYIDDEKMISAMSEEIRESSGHPFMWGDEIECFLVQTSSEDQISLCHRTKEILDTVADSELGKGDISIFPEGCRHMLETTPGEPFQVITPSIVQKNMEKRREVIESLLRSDERLVILPNYPRFGVSGTLRNENTMSDNPRYDAIFGNIVAHAGCAPYADVEFIDDSKQRLKGLSYGVGMCALQVTCQMRDLESACFVYDKLAMIAPFLLAISGSAPIFAGKVAKTDSRWGISCAAIDDRTAEERRSGSRRKSRFETVWMYIHESSEDLNDMPVPVHEESEKKLIEAGVPRLLSKHVAHILERYSPIVYEDKLDAPDEEIGKHHFDFANSLNWHSMRIKPPGKKNGWLVEFRICDVQPTECDNARLSCFIAALSQAVMNLRPDEWRISIREMEENTRQSLLMNPVKNGRYYWNGQSGVTLKQAMNDVCDLVEEWINCEEFVGDSSEMMDVVRWVRSISDGTIPTGATKIREFINSHPLYDPTTGLVSEALCNEILREVCGMCMPPDPVISESEDSVVSDGF